MSFKSIITPKNPKDKASADLLQAMWNRVPERYWEQACMDIILFGAVRDETQEKIEKILLNENNS